MKKRFWWLQDEISEGGEGAGAAPAPTEIPADDSTESDVNWAGMADALDADDAGEDLTVEGDAEVVEGTVEEGAVTDEATLPAAAPTPAPAPTAPTTPTAVTPAPTTPPTAAPAPEQTAADYATWRTGRLGELEQQYALNEDDAAALLTEPEKILPRLAATVHMEVLESAMRAMQAMVPVAMQQMTQYNEREGQAKNLFTGVNPDLADPSYEPAIMQLGTVYRKVNPNASAEEAARAIGALVRSALGIAAPQAAPAAQAPRPAAPAPFTPARGGGGGNAPGVPSNPFAALAREFEIEDSE